jgi:hypothetical protein
MHRLSTRGFTPHSVRAYALAPSTDVPQCTSLQQQGISHLSCSRVTQGRPPSPAALAFQRAAARCGFASTVVVPCIRPGTVRGLDCGVNAANMLPGRSLPAWRARVCAPLGGPGGTAAGAGGRGMGFWRFAPGIPIARAAPRPRL